MSDTVGRFAGKMAFGSTQSGGKSFYLTTRTRKQSPSEGSDSQLPVIEPADLPDLPDQDACMSLPVMSATALTDREKCIIYVQDDGSMRIQLASLLWVTLYAPLGWLCLSPDFTEAVAFVLGGSPPGRQLQVRTDNGLATVYYTVNTPSPLLTINGGGDALNTFAPVAVTPSLDQILADKACPNGDLTNVDLHGLDLSGVNFTGARFQGANLTGTVLNKTTLTKAVFDSKTLLLGINCDGAVLDQADFTGANLDKVAWGTPASAQGIVLAGCSARDAVLGGQMDPLDCTNANISNGDFRGANMRGLLLERAQAGGAVLAGAYLDKANLDKANLSGAIAVGASLAGATLRDANAQGAIFIGADLTGADLSRARMGAKAYLFTLPSGDYVTDLDQKPYVQPNLQLAFSNNSVAISLEDPVKVVSKGHRWQIVDPNGPYDLVMNTSNNLDVFSARPDIVPAVLRDANCEGAKAPGASLSGADLRRVRWHSSGATLDHAHLEGAVLSGSFMVGLDFTQAYLSGADLSNSVLVQARFRGCTPTPDNGRRAFSLEGSLLQGADFTGANLLSALLVDAGVSMPQGVPLFSLPLSDRQYLTTAGLATLSPKFAAAGYPLGTRASVAQVSAWLLDNQDNPDTQAPRTYQVRATTALQVYDWVTGKFLFNLQVDQSLLNNPTAPPALVSAFAAAKYSLVDAAPITAADYWQIKAGSDVEWVGTTFYPTMRVFPRPQDLFVYGSSTVSLRDWPEFDSVAFGATQALGNALNPSSLGPSGYPRSWVDRGLLDWETFLTAAKAV